MKKILLALALAGFATPALVAPALADPPQPKIVVIDKAAIMQFSKVGQDIAKQMQTYATQAKADLSAQGKALQAEGRNLQQQVAILAPDVKQKRLDAFRAKEEALQGEQLAHNMWTRTLTSSPQITTYYLGYAKVTEVYEAARAAGGDQFDLRGFMDGMMQLGPVRLEHYLDRVRKEN
jgi:Skp family chaperone for outer membrane proteins